MVERTLYLAGGLFNAGQREFNMNLSSHLTTVARWSDINLSITLPQIRALERFNEETGLFDIRGIVTDCVRDASCHDYVLCNLDGADADSGTAVEYGIAVGVGIGVRMAREAINGSGLSMEILGQLKVPKVITYRTDFRTSLKNEVGVNAMFGAHGSRVIYEPCFATTPEEFNDFYIKLVGRIIDQIE